MVNVADLLRSIVSSPNQNGVLIALAVALIVAFVSLFKHPKANRKPSIASRVIGANFIKFAEIAGGLFCLILIMGMLVYTNFTLAAYQWFILITLILVAGLTSIWIVFCQSSED